MKLSKIFAAVSVVALVAGAAGTASAQDAAAVQKQRSDLMKSNGASMGKIVPVVRGQAEFSPAAVEAAEQLAKNAKALQTLWAPGTDLPNDQAKPEIWTNKADFDAKLAAFLTNTEALAAAAKQGKDQMVAAFGPVGGACGGCHGTYRVPQ
jgi:cytochrome c556